MSTSVSSLPAGEARSRRRCPSGIPASHRACSSCWIPAQIRSACHGVGPNPISRLLPRPFPPYDAYVCFKCFRHFRCMLQLFHFDVAKVDQGMLHMLQVFQKHVASVCLKCFICFQTYVAIVFYLDVANVSHICCQLQSWMFHVFHTHVASACSKCFIYFQMYIALKCFSYCKCFMLFDRGRAEDEQIWRATRWGRWTRALRAGRRWCCGATVGTCLSSAAHPGS
jgi:hypothetical protein